MRRLSDRNLCETLNTNATALPFELFIRQRMGMLRKLVYMLRVKNNLNKSTLPYVSLRKQPSFPKVASCHDAYQNLITVKKKNSPCRF